MTGNTSKWRAPLAGLASIAMLATMGVAATTANAAVTDDYSYDVVVYDPDQPWKPIEDQSYAAAPWGAVFNPATNVNADPYRLSSDKVFSYYSYDKAGNNKIGDVLVVKGDTKVFAQYKKAVTVKFDANGDGDTTDSVDKSVKVPAGAALTAGEYADAGFGSSEPSSPAAGKAFAGWTYSYTQQGSSDDLYTNQTINEDTVLHARFDANQNLSRVSFRDFGSTTTQQRYTLAGQAFPKFRVPAKWSADTNWQTEDQKAYDFTQPVANRNEDTTGDDLVLVAPVTGSLKNVTVKYDFAGASDRTASDYTTTADEKPVKPVEPVANDAVFTGWFTYDGKKIDFSKPISEQANFNAASNEITLHARWDTTHDVRVQYNLHYNKTTDPSTGNSYFTDGGVQHEFVYAGEKKDLPAGLEEYYQTDAQQDAAKGEYTSRKLAGWYQGDNDKDVVTSVTASGPIEFNAKWTGSSSVRLNGNGGKFDGQTYKWVTKDDSQSWQDVVSTPTRDGYTFVKWTVVQYPVVSDDLAKQHPDAKYVNLLDGKYYWLFETAGHKANVPATGSSAGSVSAGDTLYALWTRSADQSNDAAFFAFPLKGAEESNGWVPSFSNKTADYALAEKYAKTDASWKTYVDTVYALQDEFDAYRAASGQDKFDKGQALAAKLQAAQGKLVDDKAPAGTTTVYRLFNPNETRAGSHHYTASVYEYNALARKGWVREGVAFVTTSDGDPVYRAYNPNDGSHFYTLSKVEFNHAVKAGWRDEGIGFHVADTSKAPLYRIYNPNSGEHFYTTSKGEAKADIAKGWNDEGIAWNVIK